jgi:DNA polymerase-3 subunit epsilon
MTREIVLDTETTGMDPEDGHRLVEIGCVELLNHVPTGKHLQFYINPERDVPVEATAVHGLTGDFLADKPVFSQIYSEFLAFIGDAKLVIHNAEFDMKFINAELRSVGHEPIPWPRIIDTLQMARRKFPGSPANLDALCRRFGIDNTERTYHGALLDSELLAEVYLELLGGRQHGLGLLAEKEKEETSVVKAQRKTRAQRPARPHAPSPAELAAHQAMLAKIKKPLWMAE